MTRALMNIKWEQKGAEVKIQPETTGFSGFQAITINSVIDSADEINPRNISQRFSVILRDSSGNSSSLTLPEGLHAVSYSRAKIDSTSIADQEIYYWSRNTALADINLPLDEFQQIDRANIASVSLLFDQTEQGSIYVEPVRLN